MSMNNNYNYNMMSGMKHSLSEEPFGRRASLPPLKKRHLLDEDGQDETTAAANVNLNPLHALLFAATTSNDAEEPASCASDDEADEDNEDDDDSGDDGSNDCNEAADLTNEGTDTSITPMNAYMSAMNCGGNNSNINSSSNALMTGGLLSNSDSLLAAQELATRLEAFQEARNRSRVSRDMLAQAAEELQVAKLQLFQQQQQQQQAQQELALKRLFLMDRQNSSSSMGCSTTSTGSGNSGPPSFSNADLLAFGQQRLLASASGLSF